MNIKWRLLNKKTVQPKTSNKYTTEISHILALDTKGKYTMTQHKHLLTTKGMSCCILAVLS